MEKNTDFPPEDPTRIARASLCENMGRMLDFSLQILPLRPYYTKRFLLTKETRRNRYPDCLGQTNQN
jgi:hypothetical protein